MVLISWTFISSLQCTYIWQAPLASLCISEDSVQDVIHQFPDDVQTQWYLRSRIKVLRTPYFKKALKEAKWPTAAWYSNSAAALSHDLVQDILHTGRLEESLDPKAGKA